MVKVYTYHYRNGRSIIERVEVEGVSSKSIINGKAEIAADMKALALETISGEDEYLFEFIIYRETITRKFYEDHYKTYIGYPIDTQEFKSDIDGTIQVFMFQAGDYMIDVRFKENNDSQVTVNKR